MNHPRLRALAATLLIAALAAGALFAAPFAASAAPVALSGVVTGPTGAPLPGAKVEILAVGVDGALAASGIVTSSAAGLFALPALPAGKYTLRFGATASTFGQFLGKTSDSAEAQVLDLDSVGGSPWISANLAAGGTVRGTVKTTAGKAVAKYTASAYAADGSVLATALSTATGAYAFASLEPGAYRIGVADVTSATPLYAPVFSGPAATLGQARPVSVTAGAVTTQNFSLGSASRITGSLRGDCPDAACAAGTTTEPLAGVLVTPYRVTIIDGTLVAERLAARISTATGAFSISGLAPGDYALRLSPRTAIAASGTVYGERFLGGADSVHSAKRFIVGSGSLLAGLTDTLTPSSTITATFTDGTAPVADLHVRLSLYSDTDARTISEGFTDATGAVVLTGAATGTYRLSYGSHTDTPGDGITESTAFQAGQFPVFSYAGQPLIVPPTTLALKDPLGLHPLTTLTISTSDPNVGGYATIAGGLYQWNSPNVTPQVQWLRNGVKVPGATSTSYVFRAADAGSLISARITGRNVAYGSGTVVTAATPFIGTSPLSSYADPTITGTAVVGSTLTFTPAKFYTPGVLSTISWQRVRLVGNPEEIVGETGTTHVVTAADLVFDDTAQSRVRAVVTATRQGYAPVSYTVDSAIVTEGTLAQSKAATVSAIATTFTAKAPTVAPAASTDYTWVVYDAAGNPAATTFGPTLPRAGKTGKKITVTVRTQRPGYTPRLVVLVAQSAPAPTATGSLAITGTPMVDSPLTAPMVVFTPALDKAPGYQWSSLSGTKWKNIVGATTSSFTPTAAQKGLKLRVVITGASTGFVTRTVTSTTTAPVATANGLAVITAPTFTGTLGFDRTITVSTGSWSPTPTSYSYQWRTSTDGTTFTAVAGATKPGYHVPATALGRSYAVTVTAARAGYASASTTVQAGTVTTGTIRNITPPTFTEVSPDHYRVTSNGTWSHPTTSFDYIWVYSQPATGNMSVGAPVFSSGSINQQDFDGSQSPTARWRLVVRAQGPGASFGDSAPLDVRKGIMQSNGAVIVTNPAAVVGSTVSTPVMQWNTFGATTKSTQWQITSSLDPVPAPESWTDIPGATQPSLALTPTMLDKTIRVRSVGQAPGYRDTAVYSSSRQVFPGESPAVPVGAAALAIVGNPTVGRPSSFIKATYPPGWTASYEWWTTTANGWTSMGSSATYTPAAAGALLVVKATVTRPGYAPLLLASTNKTVGFGVLSVLTKPVVTKSATGQYTVTSGSYTPAATPISYRWSVTSATGVEQLLYGGGPSYTPPAAHDGKLLTVELTVSNGNNQYVPLTVVTVARAGTSVIEFSSEPYLSGSHHVGQSLTFDGGTWTMPNPALAFMWKRSGVVIPGATSASYIPTIADIGKQLTLTVTASKPNLGSATRVLSAAGITLSDVIPAVTVSPEISGPAVVGSLLSATSGSWNLPGLRYAYQWQRNGSPIAGATGAVYRAMAADLGQDVSVIVTADKLNYYQPKSTPSSSLYISAGTFASAGTVTLTTPATQLVTGKPLTVALAGWAANATLTFQWERSEDGTTYAPIVGATGKTFTATSATAGYLRLTVTGAAPGYTTQIARTVEFRVNP